MNDTDRTAYWTMTNDEDMNFIAIDRENQFGMHRPCFRCDRILGDGDVFLPVLGKVIIVICLECILTMFDKAPIPTNVKALELAVSGLSRIANETQ